MDAGNGAGANVIGQMAQHNAVHQSRSNVVWQQHLQPGLDVLQRHSVIQCQEASSSSTAAQFPGNSGQPASAMTHWLGQAPAPMEELPRTVDNRG